MKQATPRNLLQSLPSLWWNQFTDSELVAEETLRALSDPSCKDWVGLKVFVDLLNREAKYYTKVSKKTAKPVTYQYIDDEYREGLKAKIALPEVKATIGIQALEKMTYQDLRILNLLTSLPRKEVAKILGIKKARLSQLISAIRIKMIRC